jgi:hypothetical protein
MTTKREELEKYRRGEGCLYRMADNEPIFILRGEDKFFVPLVRLWIELVEMDAAQPLPDAVADKLMAALENANAALDWQSARR